MTSHNGHNTDGEVRWKAFGECYCIPAAGVLSILNTQSFKETALASG